MSSETLSPVGVAVAPKVHPSRERFSLTKPLIYLLLCSYFVLVVFPAFWAAAEVAERRHVPALALAALGTCGIGLLSVLTVNWYYVF